MAPRSRKGAKEEEILVETPEARKKKRKATVAEVLAEDEAVPAPPEVQVEEEKPVEPPAEPEPVCPGCGLPRSEFGKRYAGLRPDLRTRCRTHLAGRIKCPKCMTTVDPY